MWVTEEQQMECFKDAVSCCLAFILAIVVGLIFMPFIKIESFLMVLIITITLIGGTILFCCLLHWKEIKEYRQKKKVKKEDKKEKKRAMLESNYYTAGMPRNFGSSSRQTELREAPSIIVCQVCGANNEKSVKYCHNCGAKII